MTLEETIMQDLKEAMKAKDQAALRGIRAIKAAILLAKTDGSGEPVDEAKEIKILQKLVKQRKESVEIFNKENRTDLAEKELEEINVIEKYLPKQLSEEELSLAIKKIIESSGATSIKDMGKVIGAANKELGGKAEGKAIAEMVKKILSA